MSRSVLLALVILTCVTPVPRTAHAVPQEAPSGLPISGLLDAGPARPGEQIAAPGRRAAWFGSEQGDLEAWVYPLKVLRGLDLRFTFRDRTFAAPELARTVEVRPEWTAITYGHEAFRVRQVVATPIDQPAALLLLEVDASFPVTVELAFHIDLQPMWPAGLGGQYSYWDAELPGFVMGEGSGRNVALIASPAAADPTSQPAHSLPDQPTRFAVRIEPGGSGPVPVVVTAWTEGMEGVPGLDGLRERYRRLVADPIAALETTAAHYRDLAARTVSVSTPEPALDEAYRWAVVRLDQGMVCNPHLGCGLIAGYGRARAGYRPGFGWFFGGDALYNSWAFTAAGAHDTVAAALEFLAAYQRDDGKIMHELSQGAGTLDWFEDYPYGFYHAEGSPYFIDAVARHVRATGDLEWGRRMLPAVRRAYEYSLTAETDGDGLMENTVAGLGAVEMGALREAAVHQDLYLVSIWTRALGSLVGLAEALGEPELARDAGTRFGLARASLETLYWMEDAGHYAFGTTTDGGRLEELTLWSAMPAALGLAPEEHGARNVATVASPAITTDWGTRMLASTSALYDPLVYNQGTVWPFLSGFAGLAAWEYGNPWAGLDLLRGLAALTADHSRGAIHEVLSGDRYHPMGPSVPHQLFSTSSLVTPLIGGLFGLDVDAAADSVWLRPQLPTHWGRAEIAGVPYRGGKLGFVITQRDGEMRVRMRWEGAGDGPRVVLEPRLPAGAVVASIRTTPDGSHGARVQSPTPLRGPFPAPVVEVPAPVAECEVALRWDGGLPISFDGPRADAAGRDVGLRVTEAELRGGSLRIRIAGRPGIVYRALGPDRLALEYAGPADMPGAAPASGVFIDRTDGGWELRIEGEGAGHRAADLVLRER